MKTITAFLLGVLLAVLSLTFVGLAFKSIDLSNQLYTTKGITDVQDFQFTFLTVALVQLVLAIILATYSFISFQLFLKYFNRYLADKRDRDVKKHIEDAKYNGLVDALNATNTIELKEKRVEDYYNATKGDRPELDLRDFMKVLKQAREN